MSNCTLAGSKHGILKVVKSCILRNYWVLLKFNNKKNLFRPCNPVFTVTSILNKSVFFSAGFPRYTYLRIHQRILNKYSYSLQVSSKKFKPQILWDFFSNTRGRKHSTLIDEFSRGWISIDFNVCQLKWSDLVHWVFEFQISSTKLTFS